MPEAIAEAVIEDLIKLGRKELLELAEKEPFNAYEVDRNNQQFVIERQLTLHPDLKALDVIVTVSELASFRSFLLPVCKYERIIYHEL